MNLIEDVTYYLNMSNVHFFCGMISLVFTIIFYALAVICVICDIYDVFMICWFIGFGILFSIICAFCFFKSKYYLYKCAKVFFKPNKYLLLKKE